MIFSFCTRERRLARPLLLPDAAPGNSEAAPAKGQSRLISRNLERIRRPAERSGAAPSSRLPVIYSMVPQWLLLRFAKLRCSAAIQDGMVEVRGPHSQTVSAGWPG